MSEPFSDGHHGVLCFWARSEKRKDESSRNRVGEVGKTKENEGAGMKRRKGGASRAFLLSAGLARATSWLSPPDDDDDDEFFLLRRHLGWILLGNGHKI